MSLVRLEGVELYRGARKLFGPVELRVEPGDRIGLVGPNGAGKSTLLRLIAGMEEPDHGRVSRAQGLRCGFLPQEPPAPPAETVWSVARRGLQRLFELADRLRALEGELAHDPPDPERLLGQYGRLRERFEREGGYEAESRVRSVLFGLGFQEADLERPAATLSGGERARLHLARLLLEESDLLILDEPTNHLDLNACEWLENYLKSHPGALLIVSHDRYLLNQTVERIWEIDNWDKIGIQIYRGNWTQAQVQREQIRKSRLEAYKAQAEEIERLESFIRKFGAGTRAAQAKSRKRRLEKMERLTPPQDGPRGPAIRLAPPPPAAQEILRLEGLGHGFDGKRLFSGLDLRLRRGERLALLGANGSGKSTLLKIIAGELEPAEGRAYLGRDVKVAYYAQQRIDLDPEESVLESLLGAAEGLAAPEARSVLGAFQFRGDDAFKKVSALSGGERSRLALARIVVSPASLLLLDEPTNHLDLQAREALEEALLAFEGAVVLVSHDRSLIDRLAQRSLVLTQGEARWVEGGYAAYRQSLQQAKPARKPAGPRPGRPAPPKRPSRALVELEERIERLEAEKKGLEETLAQPDLYEDRTRADEAAAAHAEVSARLESLYEEWLEIGQEGQ